MANPYSILHNYDNVPLFTHDFESLGALLQAKQGALNENRNKLQNAVNQLGVLDIYKDVDKNYTEERLQAVVNNVNQYAGMDLSDTGLATSLTQNLNKVMDDNVKNAVYSTKLFRAEQAQWEKAKNEKDSKYDTGNHAWSMQFSEGWRSSEKVGEVYKGGGGFVEYVDYKKMLNEKLPDIAKMHNWEIVSLENGNPLFREAVTKRSIPRNKVDQAIEAMLGSKERKQIGIDAWVKYDAVPDRDLKEVYDRNISEKVSDIEKRIEYYEAIADTTGDEEQKRQIQEHIDAEKGRIGLLQNSYFDKVGKKTAYTSMFYEEFKSPLLEAYSRDPEVVKREVNDLDLQIFNANTKLRELALADDKFEFEKDKFALDLRYKYDALEAGGKGKGKGTGQGNKQIDPNTGLLVEVPELAAASETDEEDGYKERVEDDLEYLAKQESEAMSTMKGFLRDNGLPEGYVNNPSFIAKITSNNDHVYINKPDGTKVKINLTDAKVGEVVQKFQNHILNDSPMRKKANEEVDKMTNTIIRQLSKSIEKGSTDWDPNEALINPVYKLTKDPKNKGKYITEKVDRTKVKNYFVTLLWKKGQGQKLSEEEQLNLTTYTKQQLTQDNSLTEGQKALINSNMERTVLKNANGVSKKQIRVIEKRTTGSVSAGQAASAASNAIGGIPGFIVRTAGNILSATGLADKTAIELPEWADVGDRSLSDLTYGDLEWGSSFSGKNPGGVDETISKYMRSISAQVHQDMFYSRMNPTQSTININPEDTPLMHKKLVNFLNLPTSFDKQKMFLQGVKAEDGSINEFKVMYKKEVTTKKDGVSTTTVETIPLESRISTSDANRVLGLRLDSGAKPMYNAMEGDNAAKINLGYGVIDYTNKDNLAKITRLRNNFGGALPLEDTKSLVEYANRMGVGPEIKSVLGAAVAGKFRYEMVSNGSEYVIEIKRPDGTVLGSSPTGISELDAQTAHSRLKLLDVGHAQTALMNVLNTQYIPRLLTIKSLEQ